MASATTVSAFSCARSSRRIRTPSLTAVGSSSRPLRVTAWTVRVIASMNVDAPAVAVKRTVVVDPNTSAPRVRSSVTSYSDTASSAARSSASTRVRFSPGMVLLLVREVGGPCVRTRLAGWSTWRSRTAGAGGAAPLSEPILLRRLT